MVAIIAHEDPKEIAALVLKLQERQEINISVKGSKGNTDDLIVKNDDVSKIVRDILITHGSICK